MIVSNLQNSQRVERLHPLFKTLFDYVKTHDLFHAELGRIEIDGDNLFINNVNPECVARDKQVLELHRDFVDLLPGQFMIVYPEDPHAPLIGQGKIRKLIAKVKL